MKLNKGISSLVIFVLIAAMLCTVCPLAMAKEEETETIHIQSAEDLTDLAEHCTLDTWSQGITVELDADISLDSTSFTPIPSFGGTFRGNGHTISGLSLSGKMSHAGLFNTLQETALVVKLNVSGSIDVSGCEAAGGIAAVNNGTISRCSFSGSITGADNTGGIAGKVNTGGAIWSCQSAGAVYGDSMTGGIVGQNQGLIAECTNAAYVNTSIADKTISTEDISLDISFDVTQLTQTDSLSSTKDSGGIAGYNAGVIRDCTNSSAVGYQHIGYNVGGIAGRSCGYIYDCTSSGAVYGRKDVGGIIGQMEPYIEISLSQSTLNKIQTQLNDLNTLIDTAANDAEGGINGVASRLNTMSGYVDQASEAAEDVKVVIDADGSLSGSGIGSHSGSLTVSPGSVSAEVGTGSGASVDVNVSSDSASIDLSKNAEAGADAGATDSTAQIDSSSSVDAAVDGSAQVVATPDLGNLTSAINGIGSQISQLSGAMSGATSQLASDVRKINDKFQELSDTFFGAVSDVQNGNIITDTSASVDISTITLGKLANSENTGTVDGDINVGGIAGAMAMEYSLDPEDDVSSDLSGDSRREYELKVVLQSCTNSGAVTAKRSYVGGICGRMDLGLITDCCGFGQISSESGSYVGGIAGLTGSTVRNCFSKCILSGQKYVGGIVGSGITESITGSTSSVSGCSSMVEIQDASQYIGAVSGALAGDYLENVFVSDTLAGIDGQSYSEKAEPVSYEELLEKENLPEEMQQLHLQFVADDTILSEETFQYGDSFSEDGFPSIPVKEGYYAVWDKTDLTDLHFDTVVTAVYTPYTTTVSSDSRREDGKSVFLLLGDFDSESTLTAEAQAVNTADFAPISDGLGKAISHYLKSTPLYALPSTPINRDVAEQWHITLPEDGQDSHTIRYLPTSKKVSNTRIYLRQDDGWEEADCETFGSYLTFQVTSSEVDIAAVSVLPIWWAWILAALLFLTLLLLILHQLHKFFRKRRNKRQQARQQQIKAAAESGMPMMTPGHTRKRIWWIVLILLLVGVLILAAFFFLGSGKRLLAYEALDRLISSDMSMQVTVQATVGDTDLQVETQLQQKTENEQTITYLQLENVPLYYADGAVILENGRAYRITDSLPDYNALLTRLTPLFKELKASYEDGAWEITAEGSTAQQLLTSILPELSDSLPDTQQITARITLDGLSVQQIELSANGVLTSADTFCLSLLIDSIQSTADFTVPQAVLDSISDLSDDLPVITEDWLTLLSAWQTWQEQKQVAAAISLSADCGPIVVDSSLDFYAWEINEQKFYGIQKDSLSLYWSGDKTVHQDGSAATSEEEDLINSAQLLDLAYLICEESNFVKSERGDTTSYTIELSGSTMENLAETIAPDISKLDLTFTDGSLTVRLKDGKIRDISFQCTGQVKVVVLDTSASVSGTIRFQDTNVSMPDSVLSALQ